MERVTLTASEGMMLTDGYSFGKTAYLAEGADESAWHEITEEEYNEIMNSEEAEEADYVDALGRFGV